MMWKIVIMGGGAVKTYLVQAATMPAAISKALRNAYPGKPAANPLTITVERAQEGLLLEDETQTSEGGE